MKKFIKKIVPKPILKVIKMIILVVYRNVVGRPYAPLETTKAKHRRVREEFFEKYCRGKGLDIGYGGDPITKNCKVWDIEHGDAHYLKGIKSSEFDFVYSSHTFEHMGNLEIVLSNWWRVLRGGGYLILYVPHRDLYEKKRTLPSHWNKDHKHFFLIDHDEPPDTVGIIPLIQRVLTNYEIIYAKECSEGHTITGPEVHSDGEYSIEVVIKKKK